MKNNSDKGANDYLSAKLRNLPALPGVYQFKDSKGKLLYIGKAKSLRDRVRSYFQSRQQSTRLSVMIKKISDVEIITTDNEVEALILELNLIQEHKPRYNVNLKDDKSYPYIVITNEPFPRVFPTRKKRNDGSRYFGPYTDVKNMRYALKSVRDIFAIRSCKLNLTEESIAAGKFKVCLDYHINKCDGPCEGFQSREDYNNMIDQVAKLLNGKTNQLLREMKNLMNEHAERMEFEKAAKLRDKIEAIEVYSSRQKMVDEEINDRDIFAIEREDNDACGMVLKIRDGKVIGKSHYMLTNILEESNDNITEKFLSSYYTKSDYIPDQIYLEEQLENQNTLLEWLSKKKNSKVEFVIPRIGEKAKLVFMVKKNARLMLDELQLTKLKREFIPHSVEALKRDLRLDKLPKRIECYDISHTQGTDSVASMVVFIDGKPKKSDYRKFKLYNVMNQTGMPDDFLSMREVIYRRFRKIAERSYTTDAEIKSDESFGSPPDLIVVDGGKGQLSSAVKVMSDIGLSNIPVIGLAKRLEEVYLPGNSEPQSIPHMSSGLKLLQRLRDEAHRVSLTVHRARLEKRTRSTERKERPGRG